MILRTIMSRSSAVYLTLLTIMSMSSFCHAGKSKIKIGTAKGSHGGTKHNKMRGSGSGSNITVSGLGGGGCCGCDSLGPTIVQHFKRGFMPHLGDRKCIREISESDINNDALTGTPLYKISSPGMYILTDNIVANPTNDNTAIISIESDNVILDLGFYTIQQSLSNVRTITGIKVAPDVSDVAITNGVVRTINGTGILIDEGVENLHIKNIKVCDCNLMGVELRSVNTFSISDITITHCDGSHPLATQGAVGLKLFECANFFIENGMFSYMQHIDETKDGIGVIIEGSSWGSFKNCAASYNTGKNARGFWLRESVGTYPEPYSLSVKGLSFELCEAVSNEALYELDETQAEDAYGFLIDSAYANTFVQCCALLNGTLSTSNRRAAGFYLIECRDHEFYLCKANKQDASWTGTFPGTATKRGGQAYGFFSLDGRGNKFKHCVAEANISSVGTGTVLPTAAVAAGFALVNDESRSLIEQCSAIRNNGGQGQGFGIMLGHPDTQKYPLQPVHCLIRQNVVALNSGMKQYGIKDFSTTSSSLFLCNFAFGQGAVNPGAGPTVPDTGSMNYFIRFTGLKNSSLDKLIVEGSLINISDLDCGACENISIIDPEDENPPQSSTSKTAGTSTGTKTHTGTGTHPTKKHHSTKKTKKRSTKHAGTKHSKKK